MDKKVFRAVTIAFFAAIICVSGFFKVMLPGMQTGVVLQNAMCVLTAVLIGGVLGVGPSALFFAVGVLGVPIFAGWIGGFSVLTNINGGYRIGWVIGALVAGLVSGRASVEEKRVTVSYVVRLSAAVVLGMLALYLPEIFYVIGFNASNVYSEAQVAKLALDPSLVGTPIGVSGALKIFFFMFFAPFLLVDFAKAVFVVLISLKVRPVVAQYFYG